MLVEIQGLSLMQQGKIYQYRPSLLYFCETLELTVVEQARLHEVKCFMIRMICGVRLVDRIYVVQDRVGVVVKIDDMIMIPAVVWSFDLLRHQLPNIGDYGA